MSDAMNTKESFNRLSQASLGALQPLIQLNRLNLDVAERMAQFQIDAGRDYLDMQTRAAERWANTRDFNEVSKNQESFAAEFADSVNTHLEKIRDISMETQQAYAEWFQDAMEKAVATGNETLREAADVSRQATQESTDAAGKASRQASGKAKQASDSKKS